MTKIKKYYILVEQNFEDSILNNKELSNFRLVDEIKVLIIPKERLN